MTELWLLLIAAVLLAGMERQSRFAGLDRTGTRRYLTPLFAVQVLLLGSFIGLREWCNDTGTYREVYQYLTQPFPAFWQGFDPRLTADPGFNLCNGLLKTLGFSSQNFLMFYALVTVALYLLFLRKFAVDYRMSMFLFFTADVYLFCAAGIKQAIATAIAFHALPFLLARKQLHFVLLVLLAASFHPYALIFLLLPLLIFRPWSGGTWLILLASAAVSLSFDRAVTLMVSITSAMGEAYTVASFTEQGVNIFRVLVCNVPLLLSLVYRPNMCRRITRTESLLVNMAMMNGIIMFIGLFGTANYFARLANFFLPAQVVVLPWMMQRVGKKDRAILTAAMVAGYLLYFYYSCNVVTGSFDAYFHRLTWREYWMQLY